jgi:hypothetical protein
LFSLIPGFSQCQIYQFSHRIFNWHAIHNMRNALNSSKAGVNAG